MKTFRAAGLIYGLQEHHLDHIAPIATMMEIPLIITEPCIEELTKRYYPGLITLYCDALELGEQLVQRFDCIISSLPRALFDQIVFIAEKRYRKRVLNIWCPHGNSDKGHIANFMEGLSREEVALVYGQKMIDFMIEKGVYSQLYDAIVVGNYRYRYYQMHAHFYDQIVHKEITLRFKNKNSILLYAPTWADAEHSSSFQKGVELLTKLVPTTWNVIIKLHPNTLAKTDLFSHTDNILILRNFPPIYPLLNLADAYLGDFSSIGYDALTFETPLFFLNCTKRSPKTDKGLYLHRCGTTIEEKDFNNLFAMIEESNPSSYNKIQREVYAYTFENGQNFKEHIWKAYETIPLFFR